MGNTADSARFTILREAVRHADEVGIENLRVDVVLRRAHASSSSLYHHYRNREGLLDAVRGERQRLGLLDENPALLDALDGIASAEEFQAYLVAQMRRLVTDADTIQRRQVRLEALSRPGTDRPVDRLLGMLIGSTSTFVQTAIDRGLCNPKLDARAYAVMFMSLSLGQFATRNLVDDERWLATTTEAIVAPLRLGA